MSNERRSAFSRAVRSINPDPRAPGAWPFPKSRAALVAELELLQATVAALRAQLENLCDRAEEWRAISEFVEPEAIAIRQSRALLARLEAEPRP